MAHPPGVAGSRAHQSSSSSSSSSAAPSAPSAGLAGSAVQAPRHREGGRGQASAGANTSHAPRRDAASPANSAAVTLAASVVAPPSLSSSAQMSASTMINKVPLSYAYRSFVRASSQSMFICHSLIQSTYGISSFFLLKIKISRASIGCKATATILNADFCTAIRLDRLAVETGHVPQQ